MAIFLKPIDMKLILHVLRRNSSDVKSRFNNLEVGDKVSRTRKVTKSDINQFSIISGDHNIIHSTNEAKPIVHGAFLNALVSSVIGTELPGHGTVVLKQTLNFPNKCYCDETVTTIVEIVKLRKIIEVNFKCVVQDEEKIVLYGDAKLMLNR